MYVFHNYDKLLHKGTFVYNWYQTILVFHVWSLRHSGHCVEEGLLWILRELANFPSYLTLSMNTFSHFHGHKTLMPSLKLKNKILHARFQCYRIRGSQCNRRVLKCEKRSQI